MILTSTVINATTSKMCMKPDIVLDVTIPRTHNTIKITQTVQSILVFLL